MNAKRSRSLKAASTHCIGSQQTIKLAVPMIATRTTISATLNTHFSVPKCQLPIMADLTINRLRMEACVERQRAVFEIDDDVTHVPSPNNFSLTF